MIDNNYTYTKYFLFKSIKRGTYLLAKYVNHELIEKYTLKKQEFLSDEDLLNSIIDYFDPEKKLERYDIDYFSLKNISKELWNTKSELVINQLSSSQFFISVEESKNIENEKKYYFILRKYLSSNIKDNSIRTLYYEYFEEIQNPIDTFIKGFERLENIGIYE